MVDPPPPSTNSLPPPDEAVELPVDDLALRLFHLIADERQSHLLQDAIAVPGHWEAHCSGPAPKPFLTAIHEAWWWLRAHGLVVPRDGAGGWCDITRRGTQVLKETKGLALVRAEARLGTDLHPLLDYRVRRQFILGEYELAVFAAMKTVEVRVREISALGPDLYGVPLVRRAFKAEEPDVGPLADPTLQTAEREAVSHLYAGALGFFKNPTSHRNVDYSDPILASEVILFADLLLRMLENRTSNEGGM